MCHTVGSDGTLLRTVCAALGRMTPVAPENPDVMRLHAAKPSKLADVVSRVLDPAVLTLVGASLVVEKTAPDFQRLLMWLGTIVVCYLVVPSAAVCSAKMFSFLKGILRVPPDARAVDLVVEKLHASSSESLSSKAAM